MERQLDHEARGRFGPRDLASTSQALHAAREHGEPAPRRALQANAVVHDGEPDALVRLLDRERDVPRVRVSNDVREALPDRAKQRVRDRRRQGSLGQLEAKVRHEAAAGEHFAGCATTAGEHLARLPRPLLDHVHERPRLFQRLRERPPRMREVGVPAAATVDGFGAEQHRRARE